MGYQAALEAAGAKIKEFVEFGSYQGTWMALLDNGQIIEGSYGSCSGCDSFQAEFDSSWTHEHADTSYYSPEFEGPKEECPRCDEYKAKLKEFGEGYLGSAVDLQQLIGIYEKKCTGEYTWEDDKEILTWLKGVKG